MNTLIKAAIVAIALGAGTVGANAQTDQDRVLDIINGSGIVDIK